MSILRVPPNLDISGSSELGSKCPKWSKLSFPAKGPSNPPYLEGLFSEMPKTTIFVKSDQKMPRNAKNVKKCKNAHFDENDENGHF